MERRPDLILLRAVKPKAQHNYAALSHDQEETIDHFREERPSEDRTSASHAPSDRDESSRTRTGSETSQTPTQEHTTENHATNEESSKPEPVPSTTLHRSGYILFLVLVYVGLAIFSWAITCYLSFRPITTTSYGPLIGNGRYVDGSAGDSISLYNKNKRWYHAARIIQSIVSLLTIPLTSAVCSSAAVIFVQKRHSRGGLSMRQVITIADKGWTDIPTYVRIFPFFGTKGWKRYGSSFLLLAIFVNLLGSLISPLQAIFLTLNTIKAPAESWEVSGILDIPDQWARADTADTNLIVALTRGALESTTNLQRQAQLWQGANVSCVINGTRAQAPPFLANGTLANNAPPELPQSCIRGGVTLGDILNLEQPFLAQLPSGYNTGLIQQFIPRINSTAQYHSISADEFPKACDQIEGAFYADYSSMDTLEDGYLNWAWGLRACMPANLMKSPWDSTRDRQDFTEELYLNVTVIGVELSPVNGSAFYKITLDTTAGYFELPNYMNGGLAGPLLDKDPNNICGKSCEREGFSGGSWDIFDHDKDAQSKRGIQSVNNDLSQPLESVVNKGPLLTVAMALFGRGSLIQAPQLNPAYVDNSTSTTCVSLTPLLSLLADGDGGCIMRTHGDLTWWVSIFNEDKGKLANAFTSAAFLANKAWLENNIPASYMSLSINFDMGIDTQIPVISRTGLILISITLGMDVVMLLSLVAYATLTPRWTSAFDSFSMMRMGASIAEDVPLLIGRETDKIDVLDKIPGCVGDRSEASDTIGRLGLGAPRPLDSQKNRRFESYAGDQEPPSRVQETNMAHQRISEEERRNI